MPSQPEARRTGQPTTAADSRRPAGHPQSDGRPGHRPGLAGISVVGNASIRSRSRPEQLDETYAAFADRDKAEQLAGSVTGTVLPFAYHPQLELIADPALLASPELYFNAGRLDMSVAVVTEDYPAHRAPTGGVDPRNKMSRPTQ
jgi:hypothetical protein